MAGVALLSCYAIICFFVGRATCAVYDPNAEPTDVFQALKINGYELASTMDSLNSILIDRTESSDPETNLEIILDELISDSKRKIDSNAQLTKAKRLLASLSILEGKNLCNSYGSWIVQQCVTSLGFSKIVKALKNEPSRRVDKILAPFVKKRVLECRQVYFDEFSKISTKLDTERMERLNKFLDGAIKKLVPVGKGENYAENLFKAAFDGSTGSFYLEPSYIYNALKNLAANDNEARFLAPVEDEKTHIKSLRKDKFDRLFGNYINEPCKYFRTLLGANVFEPITVDSMFYRKVLEDRADFYEAWLKYRFCQNIGASTNGELFDYVRGRFIL